MLGARRVYLGDLGIKAVHRVLENGRRNNEIRGVWGVCVCVTLYLLSRYIALCTLHAARRAMAAGAGILQNIHVL